jgi:hypothetical protein
MLIRATDIALHWGAVPLLPPRYSHDRWKNRHQEEEAGHAER